MKKISIICNSLYRGGAERVIAILSEEFLKSYDRVEIITWRENRISYQIDARIRIIRLIEGEINFSKIVAGMIRLRKHVNRESPELILSFLTISDILTILALLFSKVPIFVSVRNDPKVSPRNWFLRFLRSWLYSVPVGIVFQTKKNKDYVRKSLKRKGNVIPNPTFITAEMVGYALNRTKKKKIVAVGRLAEQKNHVMALDMMSELIEIYPDYTLHIFGEGPDRQRLEKLIVDKELSDRVFLEGNVSDIVECICDATLYILTSNYEGMPNALIEAMCIGLPVISTNVSGTEDLVCDGENGFLIEINDGNKLLEKVSQLLDDEDLRRKFAINSTKIYQDVSPERISMQWLKFFSERLK